MLKSCFTSFLELTLSEGKPSCDLVQCSCIILVFVSVHPPRRRYVFLDFCYHCRLVQDWTPIQCPWLDADSMQANMYSTRQLGQIGWPASQPLMSHPDDMPNAIPIASVDPYTAPYTAVLQNTYDSQDAYYGMGLQGQYYNAHCLTSQAYATDHISADQGATVQPHDTVSLSKSDTPSTPEQATHVWGFPTLYLHHQTLMEFKKDMLLNEDADADEDENTFIDWLYPSSEGPPSRGSAAESSMQWGSDTMFGTESGGVQRGVDVSHMSQFELQLTADSEEEQELEKQQGIADAGDLPSVGCISDRGRTRTWSVKKRSGHSGGNIPERIDRDNSVSSKAGSSKGSGETKAHSRQRLTVEQKRSNHIRYEKKRRALIRDGFKDLTELIPELQGGRNWSKSRILLKTVERLETLLERNEALREQMDALKSGKSDFVCCNT